MPIFEASVHRSRRSRIFVATYTGVNGGQVWRSTHTDDEEEALRLARMWEQAARLERAKLGPATIKARMRVPPAKPGALRPQLSQAEVARILRMSLRAVRETERRAFRKLLNNPKAKALWHQYRTGTLEEESIALSAEEIRALFDVAQSAAEVALIEKALQVIGI